jgi:hypothetical protein
MTKIPSVFRNAIRSAYFILLRRFIENEGLTLDLGNFKEDVIVRTGLFVPLVTVAVIESHSKWGKPDDLTVEPKARTYGSLKIVINNLEYQQQIEKIADNMKRSLEEEVVVEKMPIENDQV